MGGAGHLPLRPDEDPRAGLLHRHPAADGERVAARRARLLLHAHRHRSRATSGCAAARSSTRWAGTTTGCRPSAGCRTTTASAATRRCPTTPAFAPPEKPDAKQQVPISPAQLRRAVRAADRRGRDRRFEALWRRLGLSVDWSQTYATIDDRVARRVAARVPAQPRARRGLPGRGARRCGTSPSAPRSRRPSWRTASSPAPTTGSPSTRADGAGGRHRDHPARAAPRRASRSSRTPTTSATSRCSAPRCARRCSTSRSRCVAHHARRPREGRGHRDDLHLRRPHRRHVVARARTCRRARSSAATAGCSARPPPGLDSAEPAARRTPSWPARPSSPRARRMVDLLRASRRPRRRAARRPRTWPSSTRRATSRSRSSPAAPVVHPQRRPGRPTCARRSLARGRELHVAPGVHAARATRTGSRASTATG